MHCECRQGFPRVEFLAVLQLSLHVRKRSLPFTIGLQMYSALLLDHFQNPRNAGEIAGANAVAEIENPACGDVLRLTLKIEDRRITRAQFKAKGCVAAIACGSVLTELVTGKTLNEAHALRREDVSAAVGGVPQASKHALHLALEALSAALSAFH